MKRGTLLVYLGAAVGVGKTFAMLEEGHRLVASGADVAIGVVNTHNRPDTEARSEGLPLVTSRTTSGAGTWPQELDLDKLLQRRPEWALIDDFVHTNLPNATNGKRWEDIYVALDHGINIVTTVNIQHLESLTDVVHGIAGVQQRDTLPDVVLRQADQIELVDLSTDRLRKRLAAGEVYPAQAINAEIANYFRPGNLTALRELALLWLADEVDDHLRDYQNAHNIRATWEARERIVVALPGGPEGEALIKRAARIAARSGRGTLVAIHASGPAGVRKAHRANLIAQAELTESLGGTFQKISTTRRAEELVDFARSVNATQLVIGDTPHSRLHTFVRGPGIGYAIIRASGDIDVHTVTLAPRP